MLKWILNQFKLMLCRIQCSQIYQDTDPKRRTQPRRARCGLSLFEAMLVMLIAVPMLQQGVRLADSYIRQQAGVQESRLLTQVVTAASTFALRGGILEDGLKGFISNAIGVGAIRTYADLAPMDALLSTDTRSALGRNIQVIFYARGTNELIVLAHAYTPTGEDTLSYVPRGGIGIGLVGYVTADEPNMLRGSGLDYPISGLQALATTQGSRTPVAGDQLAIAILRMDQNVLPFLPRIWPQGQSNDQIVIPTDLNMDGNSILGAGEVIAEEVISSNIIVQWLTVTEDCTGCDQPQENEGGTTP